MNVALERGHPCPHERDGRPIGWHSRGYLPHFDAGEVFQSITFRLLDSMPQTVIERWKETMSFTWGLVLLQCRIPSDSRDVRVKLLRADALMRAGMPALQ